MLYYVSVISHHFSVLWHCMWVLDYVFAELSIVNRANAADNERRLCIDGANSEADEDKVIETLNHNGSIDIESTRQEPNSQLIGTSSTPSGIQHAASDSLVFCADVGSTSSHEGLADGRQSEQVTSSPGMNGCCKPAEEPSVSQVWLSGYIVSHTGIATAVGIESTLQLGLWASADNVKHCLTFATLTLATCFKATLLLWFIRSTLLSRPNKVDLSL